MLNVGITPVGVSPKPPKIDALAKAYNIRYTYLTSFETLTSELQKAAKGQSPALLEINEALIMPQIESITPL